LELAVAVRGTDLDVRLPEDSEEVPAPVFFSSSSPIERSAFIRGKMMVRCG
jgi:hypothetical protein